MINFIVFVGTWSDKECFCLYRIKTKSKFKVFVIMVVWKDTIANKNILFVATRPLG